MLYRPSKKSPSKFVERPHARLFLSYCLSTFHVVIWSSARPDNVYSMSRRLLPNPDPYDAANPLSSPAEQRLQQQAAAIDPRVLAVWGRDKFGLTDDDYGRRTMCYKRLSKIWDDPLIAAAHPLGEPWNQGNTVLIDDTAEKARSEPYNTITIPEFSGDRNETPSVLPQVHDYLNELAYQADVSTYIRTRPFKIEVAALGAAEDSDDSSEPEYEPPQP
jgi:hypothetical protein